MSAPGNVRPWVRLWRVEDENGWGPFASGGPRAPVWGSTSCKCWNPARDQGPCPDPYCMPPVYLDSRRRGPASDGRWKNHFGEGTRFAFVGRKNILTWVGRCHLQAAAKAGFMVGLYLVPWDAHTRYGNQAVFDLARSRSLDHIGLPEVYWAH